MRRIFYLIYDWTIFIKYKRKYYNIYFTKNFELNKALGEKRNTAKSTVETGKTRTVDPTTIAGPTTQRRSRRAPRRKNSVLIFLKKNPFPVTHPTPGFTLFLLLRKKNPAPTAVWARAADISHLSNGTFIFIDYS